MALLSDDSLLKEAEKQATLRAFNVSARLTRSEAADLDTLAQSRGLQRGDCIRQILRAELARVRASASPTPELTELVGLRMLLHNVLKALMSGQKMSNETFDALTQHVRREKVQAAVDLLAADGGR